MERGTARRGGAEDALGDQDVPHLLPIPSHPTGRWTGNHLIERIFVFVLRDGKLVREFSTNVFSTQTIVHPTMPSTRACSSQSRGVR